MEQLLLWEATERGWRNRTILKGEKAVTSL